MFGSTKLIKERTGTTNMGASDRQERQRATLLRNKLISDDNDIVTRVLDTAKTVTFRKGDKVIEQDATDDCVYFIVTGCADVQTNRRKIDTRSAPQTIGEMAAKRAGEPRTADVIVQSPILEALVLSGSEFRKLMRDFPAFSRNLDELIDTLSRKNITQLGEATKTKRMSWTMISGIIGLISCITAGLGAWYIEVGALMILLVGAATGIVGFVCMQLLNPVLRYRNLAVAAGGALILLVSYGSLSFMLTIDGKEIQLPLIDFSVQTEMRLGVLISSCIALLVLTGICAHFDLKLEKTEKKGQK